MFAAISNVTANGIKFNGQNYDDWIEYVKLNVGLLGLDSALVMDEPTNRLILVWRQTIKCGRIGRGQIGL